MRIDIKKVKNNAYIQLVDGQGHIFHVGPATNYDSWLVALIIWEKELRKEYARKREDGFNKIENKIKEYITMDYFNSEALSTLSWHDRINYGIARARVPQTMQFGEFIKNDPSANQKYPYHWKWNERGKQLKKRLRDIYFKQRRMKKTEEKHLLKPKKEFELRQIAIRASSRLNRQNRILCLISEIEKQKGIVERDDIINESEKKFRMTKEAAEKTINELLLNGEIFQVKNDCYKKT